MRAFFFGMTIEVPDTSGRAEKNFRIPSWRAKARLSKDARADLQRRAAAPSMAG